MRTRFPGPPGQALLPRLVSLSTPSCQRVTGKGWEVEGQCGVKLKADLSPGLSFWQGPILPPPAQPRLLPLTRCCPRAQGQLTSAWLPTQIALLPCHPWETQPLPGPLIIQQTCIPTFCFVPTSAPQRRQHLYHLHNTDWTSSPEWSLSPLQMKTGGGKVTRSLGESISWFRDDPQFKKPPWACPSAGCFRFSSKVTSKGSSPLSWPMWPSCFRQQMLCEVSGWALEGRGCPLAPVLPLRGCVTSSQSLAPLDFICNTGSCTRWLLSTLLALTLVRWTMVRTEAQRRPRRGCLFTHS